MNPRPQRLVTGYTDEVVSDAVVLGRWGDDDDWTELPPRRRLARVTVLVTCVCSRCNEVLCDVQVPEGQTWQAATAFGRRPQWKADLGGKPPAQFPSRCKCGPNPILSSQVVRDARTAEANRKPVLRRVRPPA